jgi:hypothetical protein
MSRVGEMFVCVMNLLILSLIWLVGIDLTGCGSGVLAVFYKNKFVFILQIFK